MKTIFALFFIITFVLADFRQSEIKTDDLNLGFEIVSSNQPLPDKWTKLGDGYNLKIDTAEKKSGNYAVLIESQPTAGENSFGAVSLSIPGNIRGKEIELRGFLKLKNVSNGFAGLWLRISRDGSILEFENMESKGLKGTADWAQYSVKLPLPDDADTIVLGTLLTGKGQLWADDLQILVDGKDISEAAIRQLTEYKARKDKEFDKGSKIAAIPLNKTKVKDLTILGMVWGFLKYYHPAIGRGDYNWDYELFRILPKILDAKTETERNRLLSVWLESLGTFEIDATQGGKNIEEIKLNPDLFWINRQTLGDQLTQQLNRVQKAKRADKHYYVELTPGIRNPLFKNEDGYQSMLYSDAGFRLLGLFRYWNIIQYYYPNRHLIGEDWGGVLKEFIPQFFSAGSELDYKKAVLLLIGRINDTHAIISSREETLEKLRGVNYAPVAVSFIEGKPVVTHYWEPILAEKSGLKIGDVIEEINGKKISALIKERISLTPASNYLTKLRDIGRNLLRTNDNNLKVKIKREGKEKEITIECFPQQTAKVKFMELLQKPIPSFKLISPEIAYLYPGSLKEGEIEKFKPEIAKTKGLIIDFRSYPSKFIVFSLGSFLVPKETEFVKFSQGSLTAPGLFTYRAGSKIGKENKDYYQGKVVILINELTQSSAEYTTMALRTAPRAVVIGSTTAGADGNVSEIMLPGGISTMISGIGIYYPNGKETQRVGIIPDIEIKPTIKGFLEGKDELLEKAIEIIKDIYPIKSKN